MAGEVRLSRFLHVACAVLVAVGAGNAAAVLDLVGSEILRPVARESAENLGRDAAIAVRTQGGGSDAGVQAVLAGSADIGLVARSLTADEARRLVAVVVGFDGIAVAVNERNPLAGLSHAQVHALFTGRVSDWRELNGGAFAGAVIPVIRAPGRAERQLFDQHFRIGMLLPTHAVELGTNLASLLYLSSDPQAVGYVSMGALAEGRRRGLKVKSLAIDGVPAANQSCRDARYPLCRPLLLVTRNRPGKEAQRFIEFMSSPTGRTIIEQHGFLRAPEARP